MNQNDPPNTAPISGDEEAKKAAREAKMNRLEAAITPSGGGGYNGWRAVHRSIDFPLQACNLKKWAKFDSCPIEQACFVLLGYEPPPLSCLKFIQVTYDPKPVPTWEKPPDFDDVLRSLELSIANGKVSTQRVREGIFYTKQVTWPELIRWAGVKAYAVPPELQSAVADMESVAMVMPAPQAAPVVEAPASEPPAARRTLWSVATPYIVEIMRAGQYANAKQLFVALESKAGQSGSPFDKGTGGNRGSLFVREISQSMALKTLQTNWPKLRAEAKK